MDQAELDTFNQQFIARYGDNEEGLIERIESKIMLEIVNIKNTLFPDGNDTGIIEYIQTNHPNFLFLGGGSILSRDEFGETGRYDPWAARYSGMLGANVFNMDHGAQLDPDVEGPGKVFTHLPVNMLTYDWNELHVMAPDGFDLIYCRQVIGNAPSEGIRSAIREREIPKSVLPKYNMAIWEKLQSYRGRDDIWPYLSETTQNLMIPDPANDLENYSDLYINALAEVVHIMYDLAYTHHNPFRNDKAIRMAEEWALNGRNWLVDALMPELRAWAVDQAEKVLKEGGGAFIEGQKYKKMNGKCILMNTD
ncbi:MAG: hypothetical protein US52_C0009G0004 [candidate division WS6 bacterium GW2011_GWA2_37_6]|uniref:Uncharacterized protein n=1 Tax=candidate division WS6 bacterium GW2011_GWA2_37_6 TaxID=1619087 RepID=A0A0G0H1P9_9BACT|nr:MAG: hypothetical protein US52_C0009G0004 [candidate division WS6 bacterium GW2011_GWA2_37_6]